jgi:hypothetical protein
LRFKKTQQEVHIKKSFGVVGDVWAHRTYAIRARTRSARIFFLLLLIYSGSTVLPGPKATTRGEVGPSGSGRNSVALRGPILLHRLDPEIARQIAPPLVVAVPDVVRGPRHCWAKLKSDF